MDIHHFCLHIISTFLIYGTLNSLGSSLRRFPVIGRRGTRVRNEGSSNDRFLLPDTALLELGNDSDFNLGVLSLPCNLESKKLPMTPMIENSFSAKNVAAFIKSAFRSCGVEMIASMSFNIRENAWFQVHG